MQYLKQVRFFLKKKRKYSSHMVLSLALNKHSERNIFFPREIDITEEDCR